MLINKSHLAKYKVNESKLFRTQIRMIIHEHFDLKKSSTQDVTVFLSHKHNETTILQEVVCLLESLDVDVYIDWKDEDLPAKTSGETAIKIKEKITKCEKFIFLATNSAIESKWCNWELGFGDSLKYLDNLALMPITENDGTWKGNEYLQIYPVIKTNYETIKGDYFVEFNGKKQSLEKWLKKKKEVLTK